MKTLSATIRVLALFGLIAGIPAAAASGATIPAGAEIQLELLHHVNSKYSPVDSQVFFRVSEDFVQDGRVLIRKGTPVTGTVRAAAKSKSMGRAGAMNLSVKTLRAVDGTLVPLDAEMISTGRKRTGATVGMVLAFGLPGLFSKGRMAYAEKGSVYSATVSVDCEVDPTAIDETTRPPEVGDADHRAMMTSLEPEVLLAIEKGKKLKPIEFRIQPPQGFELSHLEPRSLALVQAEETVLPQPVEVAMVTGDTVTFDAWPVMQYCGEGDTELHFRGKLRDGSSFSATSQVRMTIKKKQK